jgi:monoamine oxidase
MRIERLAKKVPLERPWEAGRASDWDAQTLATWLRRAVKTTKARAILDLYISTLLTTETASLSLLHALFYVHSGTDFQTLSTLEGGAQQDRFVGGSQLVAIRLAERLGEAVEPEAPVRRIAHEGASVRVESDRLSVLARRVVVAIPQRSPRGSTTTRPSPPTVTSSPSGCRRAPWSRSTRSTTSRSGGARA